MKTTRTRILTVVIAASIVVSIIVDWNEVERGFRDGWSGPRTTATGSTR